MGFSQVSGAMSDLSIFLVISNFPLANTLEKILKPFELSSFKMLVLKTFSSSNR